MSIAVFVEGLEDSAQVVLLLFGEQLRRDEGVRDLSQGRIGAESFHVLENLLCERLFDLRARLLLRKPGMFETVSS